MSKLRIIEDGDTTRVVGHGTVDEVYDEIESLGSEGEGEFTYDISRLSVHPDDAMQQIVDSVPVFINDVMSQMNVGESEADNNLLLQLQSAAVSYLDRHDRDWYRAAVEKPIEDLIQQIADAKGTTVILEAREIVKVARAQTMGRIYTSMIRGQLEAAMASATTPEELAAIIDQYKTVAEAQFAAIQELG